MKYILGALGVILVVILAIVLISRGGRRDPAEPPLVVSQEAREGVSAVYTEQGAVVGQDRRRAIRIIVNQNERRLEVLSGYEEAVEQSYTYPNTHDAFENFLVALDLAGFDAKKEAQVEDERGVCPRGRRYIFELREYSQEMLKTWSTSCSKKVGSFNGNMTTVRRLFEDQIPDYDKRVQDVDLTGQKAPEEEQQ